VALNERNGGAVNAEATLVVAKAICEAQHRLRTYVATTRARATYHYIIGTRTEGGGWVQGREGSVHYEFTQAIALAVRPDRDIAFQVTVTFRHDGYRVIHSAADSLETSDGYDEVELVPETRTEAPTESDLEAALTAAIDEICALGDDFFGRLDPPLPRKSASA
jgi:hypothetical protein